MQGSIKQQNTFTTIAAANAEVSRITVDVTTIGVTNDSSSQIQVYRCM